MWVLIFTKFHQVLGRMRQKNDEALIKYLPTRGLGVRSRKHKARRPRVEARATVGSLAAKNGEDRKADEVEGQVGRAWSSRRDSALGKNGVVLAG